MSLHRICCCNVLLDPCVEVKAGSPAMDLSITLAGVATICACRDDIGSGRSHKAITVSLDGTYIVANTNWAATLLRWQATIPTARVTAREYDGFGCNEASGFRDDTCSMNIRVDAICDPHVTDGPRVTAVQAVVAFDNVGPPDTSDCDNYNFITNGISFDVFGYDYLSEGGVYWIGDAVPNRDCAFPQHVGDGTMTFNGVVP